MSDESGAPALRDRTTIDRQSSRPRPAAPLARDWQAPLDVTGAVSNKRPLEADEGTRPNEPLPCGCFTDVPALLKTIRSVRNQQFAYIDQQLEPGLGSISVRIFAAGKSSRSPMLPQTLRAQESDFTQRFLPILRRTADATSRDIECSRCLRAPQAALSSPDRVRPPGSTGVSTE